MRFKKVLLIALISCPLSFSDCFLHGSRTGVIAQTVYEQETEAYGLYQQGDKLYKLGQITEALPGVEPRYV